MKFDIYHTVILLYIDPWWHSKESACTSQISIVLVSYEMISAGYHLQVFRWK